MSSPVSVTPDDDTVMASLSRLSNTIPTPQTHRRRHHNRKTYHDRRGRATPNGLAFLDLEAAVDDHNDGNEQGEGGSETDNSLEGAIDSRNLLIIHLKPCGQTSSQMTETIRTTSPCAHFLIPDLPQHWPVQFLPLAGARRCSPTLLLIALHALKKLMPVMPSTLQH
jgi:hypothetical protein